MESALVENKEKHNQKIQNSMEKSKIWICTEEEEEMDLARLLNVSSSPCQKQREFKSWFLSQVRSCRGIAHLLPRKAFLLMYIVIIKVLGIYSYLHRNFIKVGLFNTVLYSEEVQKIRLSRGKFSGSMDGLNSNEADCWTHVFISRF